MSEHAQTKPIVDYDQLFPGEFLKAGLFRDRPVTLTITGAELRDLPCDKGGEKPRGLISFRETPMKLVLIKTNGECLKAMFGPRVPEWAGKRVTFFCGSDMFGGKKVDAVRIHGSPDLARPITVVVEYKRRRSQTFNLVVTKPCGATNVPQDPPPQPDAGPGLDASERGEMG